MFFSDSSKLRMPSAAEALPGRDEPMVVPEVHFATGARLVPPFPPGVERVAFGLGCFWGAERRFWQQPGVYSTAAGYTAGLTKNPTYKEVCSGRTGHNEVVQVIYDPSAITFEALLKVFWESHDPTQGMRQGNDVGTQYRSGIYTTTDSQAAAATASKAAYAEQLAAAGFSAVTTEILAGTEFFYAEAYHQQYLMKNPGGYCGLRGTGVGCPIGVLPAS